MATSAHDVRSSTNKTQETDSISQRPRTGQNSRTPHALGWMQSLIDANPRVQKFMKMNRLLGGQGNGLDQKKVLIEHFGSEVGLSMELYNKVVNGRATEEESVEYKTKSDALTELAKNFVARAVSDIQIAAFNDRSGGREVAAHSPNQLGE